VLALEASAQLAAERSQYGVAVQLAGAVTGLYASLGTPASPSSRALFARLRSVRSAVGARTTLQTAIAGSQLSLDEAVALARASLDGADDTCTAAQAAMSN
jgi:hypothetical protein